jgi:hypothetical protein
MPTDAGHPNVVSHTRPGRAGSPAGITRSTDTSPKQRRAASRTRADEASPIVEVELTPARSGPATPGVVRLSLAWLLFGAFGLSSLLALTASDPRTGKLIASSLILPLYVLTIGALVWAALETRWLEPPAELRIRTSLGGSRLRRIGRWLIRQGSVAGS